MSHKGQRMFESILKFWFEDIEPKQWWEVDADFDALIAKKFSARPNSLSALARSRKSWVHRKTRRRAA